MVVEEARPVRTTYALNDLTPGQVSLFVSQKSINKTIEDALGKILKQKNVIDDLDTKKDNYEAQAMKIFDDQQRLRENIKALNGSADEKTLLQRYTRQLNDQEDRLEALRKESEKIESQQAEAQAVLDKMIQDLSVEVTL
jgi:chaperonin cofactor prefoldin